MTDVLRAEIVFPIITCASWLDLLARTLRCSSGLRTGPKMDEDLGETC